MGLTAPAGRMGQIRSVATPRTAVRSGVRLTCVWSASIVTALLRTDPWPLAQIAVPGLAIRASIEAVGRCRRNELLFLLGSGSAL
jgi:hypothetical protein